MKTSRFAGGIVAAAPLIVILGVIGVSVSAVLFRYATAPTLVMAGYRMLLAALLLLPAVLKDARQELRQLSRRQWLSCLLCGVVLALHFFTYYEGLSRTSIASCSVLVNTEVFFVAFVTCFCWKEKMTRPMVVGIVAAFAGSVIVSLGDSSIGTDVLLGDLFSLLGALFCGCYTLIGSRMRKNMSTVCFTFLIYGSASLVLAALCFVSRTPVSGYGGVNWLVALGQAVICTLLGHSVLSWGLKYCRASFVSTARLCEAVFSTLWALLLFGEIPTLGQVVGGAMILLGILYYLRGRRPERSSPPDEVER